MIRQVSIFLFLVSLFSVFFLRAKSQEPVQVDTIKAKPLPSAKDTLPPISAPQASGKDTLALKVKPPIARDTLPPQTQPIQRDTFFLAKKHGILGRLVKSISVEPPGTKPVKIANPYLPYAGMTIRSIQLVRLGFDRNIYDTTVIRKSLGMRAAKLLHKNTKSGVIANDLLFKSGDHLFPNLLADNERLLRTELYLQDARILVKMVPGSTDSVDVIVITKDVFSIGGTANISGATKGAFQLKEENVNGSGSRAAADFLYDKSRSPQTGYGADFIRRNINGTFIDWTTGFQTFAPTFNNGEDEVVTVYTGFQRPLVTPYIPWTGACNIIVNKTNNDYISDTEYTSMHQYSFYDLDGWYGYNFGSKKLLYKNLATRLRKFIAVRALDIHFSETPTTYNSLYNYHYENIRGVLGAINSFKQDFYRTNFIYGFGIDEDVPEGFNVSLIGGWTNQEGLVNLVTDTITLQRNRPYFGFNSEITHFSKNGSYTDYIFKIGTYTYQHQLEDFNILINLNHFTKLKKLNTQWLNRNFFTASITKEVSPVFDQPLLLQSMFGLPYFSNSTLTGDFRTTVTGQVVFFNLHKFLGFRFAPFIFSDACVFTPSNINFSNSDLFGAVGGGVRTRNENLIFGTIELKGFYFPRTLPGMSQFMIQLNSNLQFKFNSTFIQEPDFITPN